MYINSFYQFYNIYNYSYFIIFTSFFTGTALIIKFLLCVLDHFAWLFETLDTFPGFITGSPHSNKIKQLINIYL